MNKEFYKLSNLELSQNNFWKNHLLGEENDTFVIEKRSPKPASWLNKIWRWLVGTFRLSFLEQKINEEVQILLLNTKENKHKLELWSVAIPSFQAQVIDIHNQRAWTILTKITSLTPLVTQIQSALNPKPISQPLPQSKQAQLQIVPTVEIAQPSTSIPTPQKGEQPCSQKPQEPPSLTPPATDSAHELNSAPPQTPARAKESLPPPQTPPPSSIKKLTPSTTESMKRMRESGLYISPLTPLSANKYQSPRVATVKKDPSNKLELFKYEGKELTYDEANGLNGKGKVTFVDGRILEGTFEKGELIEGEIFLKDKTHMKGKFQDQKLVKGKITFSDGNIFDGDFIDGTLVEGTKMFITGYTLKGKFKNYELDGMGEKIGSDKTKYEGFFSNGLFISGKITSPKGTTKIVAVDADKEGETVTKQKEESVVEENDEVEKLLKKIAEVEEENKKIDQETKENEKKYDEQISKIKTDDDFDLHSNLENTMT